MRLPPLLASAAFVVLAATAHAEPKVYDAAPVKIAVKPARPLVTEIANPPKVLGGVDGKQPVASKIETPIAAAPF